MKEIILNFIEPFPARGKAFLCRFTFLGLPLPALNANWHVYKLMIRN
jgi:hypothetical protein